MIRGWYLLADESVMPFEHWASCMPALLQQAPALVQYRAKTQSQEQQYAHASELNHWCQKYNAPLLINDDTQLALKTQAAGVHLGRDDGALRQAREQLGAQAIIGASCYNDLDRAKTARQWVDYLSFGRLFASTTKPQASACNLTVLSTARALNKPVCAIGGINTINAEQVLQAGADLLCVAGGILKQKDPVASAAKLAKICQQHFEPYS